ncbi:MAG: hypothetical protein U0V48_15055 [Anaerolineales bacterium]
MDFGSGEWDGGPIGIPFNVVAGSAVPAYEPGSRRPDESDAGPYPIPQNPNREWGSDHHICCGIRKRAFCMKRTI